ncbi:MAG: hypothetical protein WEA58_03960 [Balneolaceae bacterium]
MSVLIPSKKNSNLGMFDFSNYGQNEDGSYGITKPVKKTEPKTDLETVGDSLKNFDWDAYERGEKQPAKEPKKDPVTDPKISKTHLSTLASMGDKLENFDWDAHKRGEEQPPKDPDFEEIDYSYLDELDFSDLKITLDTTYSAGPRVKPSSDDEFFNADDGDYFEGDKPLKNDPKPPKKDDKKKPTTKTDNKKESSEKDDYSFKPGDFEMVPTAAKPPAENERSAQLASLVPVEVMDVLKNPIVQYSLVGSAVFGSIYYYKNHKKKTS